MFAGLCRQMAVILIGSSAIAADADERTIARQALEASGVRGGLVVHLGCGDGRLTAALAGQGRPAHNCLVQGLDTDAASVEKAREHIRSLGIYGPVG
ncbi:MAG: class I SAM-dependent methyltransferase, partial [Acidobacteria bacterium]|nr:class I SAM-dependent methyltransferase [Acidobacteriota bacterium]